MKKAIISAVLLATVIATCRSSFSDEPKKKAPKSTKVTMIIRGVHCDRDVKDLHAVLKKMKGIKFDASKIEKGKKPRYFTDPFVVEVSDIKKTHIGAIAKVVSEANTAHKEEFPPKLNLVLFTPERITEEAVIDLRRELMDVNGVEVLQPGGLGGFPGKGYFWVQLEDAGGAELKLIVEAARKANPKISSQKP